MSLTRRPRPVRLRPLAQPRAGGGGAHRPHRLHRLHRRHVRRARGGPTAPATRGAAAIGPGSWPRSLCFSEQTAPARPTPPGSTASPRMRSTTTTWRCAGIRARCWCPPSWPRRRTLDLSAAATWSMAFRRRLRDLGRAGRGASAAITTARAGTRPASSAPSPLRLPAPALRRLDPARTAQAIALGASQSAGLMANFGTMAKPFHAGRSAHAGRDGGAVGSRPASPRRTGRTRASARLPGRRIALRRHVDRASTRRRSG